MKTKILYIAAATAFILSGCSKDFLERTPTEEVSAEDLEKAVEQDPELLKGNVAGLYTTMFEMWTGGTEGHDDFGQKGFDIVTDMISSDMVLAGVNYGWYSGIARYTATVDFTQNAVYTPWRYYYRIIFAANTVIDALGGTDAEQETDETRWIMGQAKAMRAYAYFYLANIYSREGYGTGQELILPIYTNTVDPNQPLSSAQDVYNLIVSDLEQAVTYLDDFQRTSKDQINKYVAEGLLAYALAARGTNEDLNRVVELTNNIIANGGFSLTTREQAVGGFNDVRTNSWIWGVDITLDAELDLVSWWGQIDLFTYSYAWAGDPKTIDMGLYNKIPAGDIRKTQFEEAYDFMPTNKFYAPGKVIGGQRNIETDYVYQRVDEMYLLNAEANAKLGNEGNAISRLKELLALRLDDMTYVDGLSGQALQDEIYLQTRIEFWGEGKSYLAMKRNKATITRGPNHIFHAGQSFNYNDAELSMPIPQAEILNNPNIN